VTFNKVNTYEYYKERVYKLEADYQSNNMEQAIEKARDFSQEKFPLGVIYQTNRPTFTDGLPQLSKETLLRRERFDDFEELMKEYI